MWNGDTCGCVSGALMAIGLKYGHWAPGDRETKKRLRAKAAEFEKRFIERNNSLICKNILGYDLTVPEEFQQIKKAKIGNYYSFLAGSFWELRGKEFFKDHREALGRMGETLNWVKLGREVILQMLNMRNTVRAVKRGILARRGGKPAAQGETATVPGPRKSFE